jgi:hypothetical protein
MTVDMAGLILLVIASTIACVLLADHFGNP